MPDTKITESNELSFREMDIPEKDGLAIEEVLLSLLGDEEMRR